MARVPPAPDSAILPAARAELDRQLAAYGRVTNMKRTLAHSTVALRSLMTWYDLHAEVVSFLGPRATTLFAHAISAQTDCLICSTFFRRWLTEAGEDPDHLVLAEREQALVDFGQALARNANSVTDQQFAAVQRFLMPAQIVTLTAFAGLMVATNLFNNTLRVDLDEYLHPFRKEASS